VTRDVLFGKQEGERLPDAIVVVIDATNLDNHLRFTLQLIALGLPMVVALNMVDMAERDGLVLDAEALERELGVPVVATVAVRKRGLDELKERLGGSRQGRRRPREGSGVRTTSSCSSAARARSPPPRPSPKPRRAAGRTGSMRSRSIRWRGRRSCSRLMFVMFQAVFAWSARRSAGSRRASAGCEHRSADAARRFHPR
jgi:ferrous iron transport protein B